MDLLGFIITIFFSMIIGLWIVIIVDNRGRKDE